MDGNRDQVKPHVGASSVSMGCASHDFFQVWVNHTEKAFICKHYLYRRYAPVHGKPESIRPFNPFPASQNSAFVFFGETAVSIETTNSAV
mgnify:FL=1